MRLRLKESLKYVIEKLGFRVVRINRSLTPDDNPVPVEFSTDDAAIVEHVIANKLTMVSRERLYATVFACKHVNSENVRGDFVECGVWRGGNSIIAADVFSRQSPMRKIYLFDTFAGMTRPTEKDFRQRDGQDAMIDYLALQKETHNEWCYASLSDVKANFSALNLLNQNVRFIQGDVAESLKEESTLPEVISVLRLDTDWYESTHAELEVLYPRLSSGGVLIIDDYGHWGGAKRAVDEYFKECPKPFLQYTDYTGRMGVKPY
jgi:hypothetical protein